MTDFKLKIEIIIVLIAVSMVFMPSYAESSTKFGYQLLPEKLLENTEGIFQLYVSANGIMMPKSINNLKVVSTDNSIIKVIGVEQFNEYITNVKVQALSPGIANLVVAASGFLSEEIPIKVHNNNNYPSQIMMQLTPDDFPVDGPRFGYLSVESLTTSGLPTKAENDIIVSISSPNTDVVELEDDKLVIQKGDYFAIGKFSVKNSGDAIIFAETDGMKKISEVVHVRKASTPLEIKLYLAPTTFNSFSTPRGYAVVQLQDADGIPVNAEKDITVTLKVENPDAEINVSHDFEEILFDSKKIVIKQGTYSAYTSFVPRPNLGDFTSNDQQTFSISTSAEDYLARGASITITHQEIGVLQGEGPAKMLALPFLTTGEIELIGIMYFEAILAEVAEQLEDTSFIINLNVAVPVMANADLEINVASSNLAAVKTSPAFFNKGENVALVFGKTGTVIPEEGTELELYLTDNQGVKKIIGKPEGPLEELLNLNTVSLIPLILAGERFPVLAYLEETEEEEEGGEAATSSDDDEEEENGRIGVTHFIKDTVISFSANEYVELEPEIIKQNQPYALMMANSKKIGSTTLTSIGSGLEASLSITSHSTDPTTIYLSYPETILPDMNNIVTIQALDSSDNPVFAKEDIQISLLSNDESVIKMPGLVTIPKDSYRVFFEIEAKKVGSVEVSALAEDLSLAKFNFWVKGLIPKLSLNVAAAIDINEETLSRLSVEYAGIPISPEGLEVEWFVTGGDIIQKDSVTNENGEATIVVKAREASGIDIKAVVNGFGMSDEVSKSITVNVPVSVIPEEEPASSFENINMAFIIIPVAVAVAVMFLKRTNRLEEITERLNLGDLGERVLEIKERVSSIRER